MSSMEALMASPSPAPFEVTGKDKEAYDVSSISSITAALTINGIIGAACLVGFIIFRSFMRQYQLRSVLPYVTIQPPPLPGGLERVFGWIKPVFRASDVWLLHSAGLDALVLQKTQALCLQLFLPIAAVGCCLLLPLQLSEAYVKGDASFNRLTMANVAPGSKIMWAHWVCVFLFLGWTLLLLEYHFREYVSLHQWYLHGSDGWNYWRELHMAEADGVGVHERSKFAEVVENARMEGILQVIEAQRANAPLRGWRKKLAWLTSWTGTDTAQAVASMGQELSSSDANVAMLRTLKRTTSAVPRPLEARDAAATAAVAAAAGGPLGEGVEANGGVAASAPATGAAPAAAPPAAAAVAAADVRLEVGGGGACGLPEGGDGSEGGDIGEDMAAPRWWTMVDVVTGPDGKLRRLTAAEQQLGKGSQILLAKPSVRYRKTVNTFDHVGRPVAVHAQQFAVLVTNVTQPVYPEYGGSTNSVTRGAGCCGNPVVKHGPGDDIWLGQRHRRFADALKRLNAIQAAPPPAAGQHLPVESPEGGVELAPRRVQSAGAVVPKARMQGAVEASEAAEAVEAVAKLDAAEAGLLQGAQRLSSAAPLAHEAAAPPVSSGRAAFLWGRARAAMKDGRLSALLRSEKYSAVSAVFSALFPDDFDRVVPVFNCRETDLLMRKWDVTLARLESAEHAVRNGRKRPLFTPKGAAAPVDRIDWLRREAERLELAVLESRERALVLNSTPSFFVLFKSQKAAAIAASCNIHPLRQQLFKVHPAPGPEEVNYEALWFDGPQRTVRGLVITVPLIVLVLLPVSLLTSAMTQLNDSFCAASNTVLRWDDYCQTRGQVFKILKALLTGFVPTLLIQLWQALLMPRLVFLAAQSEGRHYSLSSLDRRMGAIYFLWGGINFFAGGVIGSTALARVPEIISSDPVATLKALGTWLSSSAKFFLTYMILRTFMTVPLRFLITQPGVWQAWIRMALSPVFRGLRDSGATERIMFMRNALRSPRYGVEYGGNTCIILLICFAFAVICPLVPLMASGTAFFGGYWIFWRYQLIYGYQRKYESGGQFFPFLAHRVLICAAVMVGFTACVMIAKAAWAQASLMFICGFVIIYAFYMRVQDLYMTGMREMPLLVAQMAPRARVPPSVYVAPPLQANGFGWWPEWNKVWAWFGMPGYSW